MYHRNYGDGYATVVRQIKRSILRVGLLLGIFSAFCKSTTPVVFSNTDAPVGWLSRDSGSGEQKIRITGV